MITILKPKDHILEPELTKDVKTKLGSITSVAIVAIFVSIVYVFGCYDALELLASIVLSCIILSPVYLFIVALVGFVLGRYHRRFSFLRWPFIVYWGVGVCIVSMAEVVINADLKYSAVFDLYTWMSVVRLLYIIAPDYNYSGELVESLGKFIDD